MTDKSERYERLSQRFEQGASIDDLLQDLRGIDPDGDGLVEGHESEAFQVAFGSLTPDNNREFDRAVAEHLLPKYGRDNYQPDKTYSILRNSMAPRAEFRTAQRQFFDALRRHHGRGAAFYQALYYGCEMVNPFVVRYALTNLRAPELEQYRRELMQVLVHRTLDGERIDRTDKSLTPGGDVAKKYKTDHIHLRTPISSVNDTQGDQHRIIAVFAAIIELSRFTPRGWGRFFKSALGIPKVPPNYQRSFLRAVSLFHDGSTFLGGTTMDVPLSVFRTHHVNKSAAKKARYGATDNDKGLIRYGVYRAFRRWHEQGGVLNESHLYQSAHASPINPRFVRYVLEHFDPTSDQLNRALGEYLMPALARFDAYWYERPFAALNTLVEAGADPEQTDPSLFGRYLKAAYKEAPDWTSFTFVRNHLLDLGTEPASLTNFQWAFGPGTNGEEDGELRFARACGVKVYRPLIRRGVCPTPDQLRWLRNNKPGLYEGLLAQLPRRKRYGYRFLNKLVG